LSLVHLLLLKSHLLLELLLAETGLVLLLLQRLVEVGIY
tara:strand:- start:341 stop:457 length:117 start_codon:yes stop_codon:yes gene_type:complete